MSFLEELKRRHVVRVALVYAAVAFIVIQAADLMLPRLGLPDWTVTLVLALALLGFPIALVLAWAFDRTPAGVRRTPPLEERGAAPPSADAPAPSEAYVDIGFARPDSQPPALVPWRPIAAGLAILVVLLIAAFAASLRPRSPASPGPAPVLRFEVLIPDSLSVEDVQLTPDGARMLIWTSHGPFLYSFADMRLVPFDVPGYGNAIPYTTTISPDGRWIAFLDAGPLRTLRVLPFEGGAVRALADSVRTARWGDDGFLYIVRRPARIERVAFDGGGPPEQLVVAGDSVRSLGALPLPGGKGVVYFSDAPEGRQFEAFVLDLRTRRSRALPTPRSGDAVPWSYIGYSRTGHLLLSMSDGLYAVAFDPDRLQITGTPTRVIPVALGMSHNAGMLAYTLPASFGPVLMNRTGVRRDLPGVILPGTWSFGASVAPAGDVFAFWNYQSPADRWDVWTYALPNGPRTRISADSFVRNGSPEFSSEGKDLRFLARRDGHAALYTAPADGSGTIELLLTRRGEIEAASPLPDGRRMVLVVRDVGLVLAPLDGASPDLPIVSADHNPGSPAVSPDGRFVAYASTEAGPREIFVRALDGTPGRWQVSRGGAVHPAWAKDGRALFFSTDDSLFVARLTTDPGFRVGSVRALFPLPYTMEGMAFAVLPGDSLFLVMAPSPTERGRVVVVANFDEELRTLGTSSATPRR